MLVLTFAVNGAGNCVEIAGRPYVYARTKLGSFILRARCAHRGGPLNLGTFVDGGDRLVCPWHDTQTSVRRQIVPGVPVVRRGNTVTAVFGVPADTAYEIGYRPLSADLRVGGTPKPSTEIEGRGTRKPSTEVDGISGGVDDGRH